MSGFVAVLRLDGAAADAALVERLTRSMAFRGPDGTSTVVRGPCALGLALLRTTHQAAREAGPATLDGQTWIAAGARIDGRPALIAELGSAGRRVDEAATDPELVLHAYAAWGPACLERLLGDFSFAIWDGPRRRLLCARDHFGVRPLFWAAADGALVVSNTLDAVLLHPSVPREPSPAAMADWLAFGYLPDPAATLFRGVHAIPPAHLLSVAGDSIATRRWWSLPVDPTDGDAQPGGAVETADAFRAVLGEAVRDRLRTDRAAVLLSGGRDSTAVAALAAEAMRERSQTIRITAHTLDGGVPEDREAEYAGIAARAFGFAHRIHRVDGHRLFERMDEPGVQRPQPVAGALLSIDADLNRALAADARVALTGDGGDPVLRETEAHLARLWQGGRKLRALREAVEYARLHHRVPRPGIRTLRRGGRGGFPGEMPRWLRADAAERLGTAERWERWSGPPRSGHPLRPEAHGRLSSTYWAWWLEQYDAGSTGVPLEYRHPFLDLRVVRFALSVPPAQWYNDKGLLRIGMRGRVPAAVLARPKTPLAYDPLLLRLQERGERPAAELHPAVAALVDAQALPAYAGGTEAPADWADAGTHLRPLMLSHWLRALTARPP